ncbi:MAG TPA: ABC transporter permease [Thermoanaerobaculia bacterium]|nr:ABC transporter permease [Thermoanaerobaculia bacterium]
MISELLVKGTPLLFCALSFLVAWKAGVVNVGAEGQFLAGALAAAAVATRLAAPGALVAAAALAAGAAAGGLWAGLASWLVRRRGVLDVLATILLNFVASGLVSVAVHGFLQERTRTFPQSDAVPEGARLPILAAGTRLHAGVLIAAALAVVLAVFLRRTKAGFRLLAAGAGPRAAEFAGIDVPRVRGAAFVAAGAAAGIGGAVELLGVAGRLFDAFSPGYGYLGLAVAVVGQLSALGTAAAAAVFGLINVLSSALQRRAGVSAASALAIEGALVLAALAAPRLRRRRRREASAA